MKIKLKLAIVVSIICLYGCSQTKQTTFRVASYNLRNANLSDSIAGNGWLQRYPYIVKLIQFHDFDIFGTQECLLNQLNDLNHALSAYRYIGVGRDDGIDKGEHSAIFYRKDKFELLDKGDFWLSQTPEEPSIGWDAVLPRICTWGHFRYVSTGFEFYFFNLHMDHVGHQARVNSASLVLEKSHDLAGDLPVILTGDFNVDQSSKSYKTLIHNGFLCDSNLKSDLVYLSNGTFNGFNPNSFTDSRIDHIFVSPSFHVKKYGVLTDTYRSRGPQEADIDSLDCPKELEVESFLARLPSDHFPVVVELSF